MSEVALGLFIENSFLHKIFFFQCRSMHTCILTSLVVVLHLVCPIFKAVFIKMDLKTSVCYSASYHLAVFEHKNVWGMINCIHFFNHVGFFLN